MIKAVVKDGVFVPLEPLPDEWTDGSRQLVEREDGNVEHPSFNIDRWYQELQALGTAQYEPGERDQIESAIARADIQAKEFVRREMGLLQRRLAAWTPTN